MRQSKHVIRRAEPRTRRLACRPAGARGHEFHRSALDDGAAHAAPAYRRAVDDALAETEGVVAGPRGNVLASYLHVHLGTDPALAERFVARAAARGADR